MKNLATAIATSGYLIEQNNTGVDAVGLDFDGTNDYLSRSSDLVGNTDSKTFTFSCWVYHTTSGEDQIYHTYTDSNNYFMLKTNGNIVHIEAKTAGVSSAITSNSNLPYNVWNHVLISIDTDDVPNSHIYINDELVPWGNGVDSGFTFDFASIKHRIGVYYTGGAGFFKGRLAHVYLDYTYRDLSVEANRRLFNQIDPDRGLIPSDTVPASPIIYCPMDDPDDQGRNDGTGGNFTVNGDPSKSERGPNQYNAVASEFDGSADYLSRTTLVGISNSYTYTVSFTLRPYTDTLAYIFEFAINTSYSWQVTRSSTSINFSSTSGSFSIPLNGLRGNLVNVSLDNRDGSLLRVFVNGQSQSISYTAGNTLFPFSSMNNLFIGTRRTLVDHLNGSLGNLYFDTSYIDLATDNPFWDSDTNKPKYLGEQGELPTGSQPLIYLPLRADDAGNNLGSGGDFTVNSGPFVGARSMSEYWARSANFDGSTGYLTRFNSGSNALTGATDGKLLTFVMAFKHDTGTLTYDETLFGMTNGGGSITYMRLRVKYDSSFGRLDIAGENSSGSEIFRAYSATTYTLNNTNWHILMLSFDMSDSGKRHIYLDDTSDYQNGTYTNDSIEFSSDRVTIGAMSTSQNYMNGDLGFLYLSTDYTDFSIEDNRRLFVDALGYPVDLQQHIDSGALPEGLIRMDFSDTSDFGINKGTGGDFTVNGTVTPGADVDPNT